MKLVIEYKNREDGQEKIAKHIEYDSSETCFSDFESTFNLEITRFHSERERECRDIISNKPVQQIPESYFVFAECLFDLFDFCTITLNQNFRSGIRSQHHSVTMPQIFTLEDWVTNQQNKQSQEVHSWKK